MNEYEMNIDEIIGETPIPVHPTSNFGELPYVPSPRTYLAIPAGLMGRNTESTVTEI